MLAAILDIALLLVSGTACLYCFVLSRRLRALQDLKKGLGASIVSLSEAISKTTVAAQEARVSAAQSAEKLARLMKDIDKSVPVVDDLIESINRSTRRAANETTRMQDDAIATIRPVLEEARTTAGNLAEILALIDARSEKLQAEAREIEERARQVEETAAKGTQAEDAARPRKSGGNHAPPGKVRMSFSLSDASIDMSQYTARVAAPDDEGEEEEEEIMDPSNPFAQHIKRLRAARDAAEGRTGSRKDTSRAEGPGGQAPHQAGPRKVGSGG